MYFKRSGKSIFGVELNSAEKKALDAEIQKEIAIFDRHNEIAFDAIVLWHLHNHIGFDIEQLKDFYDTLSPEVDRLIDHYEMGDADSAWLCVKKLKDVGVDIEKWREERR